MIRGIDPDSYTVDYSVDVGFIDTVNSCNLLIGELSEGMEIYISGVTSRESYILSDFNPSIQNILLTKLSSRTSLDLGYGPYEVEAGDSISVDGDVVYLRSIPCNLIAKRAFIPTNGIVAGITIDVTLIEPTPRVINYTAEPFPLEDKDDLEIYLREQLNTGAVSLADIDEDFDYPGITHVDVFFDGDYLTLSPSEEVMSIKVTGGLLKDLLLLPKKTIPSHSSAFLTSKQLAVTLSGSVTNNQIHTGDVRIDQGVLISPQVDVSKFVVAIGDSYFLGTSPNTPLRLIAGNNLSPLGDYEGRGRIYTEKLELPSIDIASTIQGLGGLKDASSSLASNVFTHNGTNVLTGDFIDYSTGLRIVKSQGNEITLNRSIMESSTVVSAADYEISRSILQDLPDFNTLPILADTINDIRIMEEDVEKLIRSLDALEGLISRAKSSPQYDIFCRALASIRNAHLDLKFDKALGVLYSGDFNKYFNLTEIEANFASYAAKTSRDVSRRMQVL